MTIYAGETVQIKVEATDFDALTTLDNSDITVNISIYNTALEEVLAETAMTYDVEDAAFLYAWDTTGLAAGGYRARIEALGQAATPQSVSLEYKRIRLNRRPVGD
jgi:hypothetical protein